MELKDFVERWGDKYEKPKRATRAKLADVETKFGITLPTDYVEQIATVGCPFAPSLLDAIVDNDADLVDLSKLHTPKEIVETTVWWREAGMPDTLIAIGSDCMGNQFCFDMSDLRDGAKSYSAIYFWDHDFGSHRQVATSFAAWIAQYLGPWSQDR